MTPKLFNPIYTDELLRLWLKSYPEIYYDTKSMKLIETGEKTRFYIYPEERHQHIKIRVTKAPNNQSSYIAAMFLFMVKGEGKTGKAAYASIGRWKTLARLQEITEKANKAFDSGQDPFAVIRSMLDKV